MGSCHQFGDIEGSNLISIFEKTKLGRAIVITKGVSKLSTFSGTTFLLISKKPIRPMPSRVATDSNVTSNRLI